ncbi:MAG: hypothetical protein QF473_14360 [Planctomycetota bacterium]|nr:hypothetical protein [Planctomycetota bacterium]
MNRENWNQDSGMRIQNLWIFCLVLLSGFARGEAPWQKLYTGDDATGSHVLGLWQFQPGKDVADSSGNGHKLRLRGKTRVVSDGKFGSCLESFAAGEGEKNHAEGAFAVNKPDLTPKGAFTLELWFKLKNEAADHKQLILLDKKYYHYVKDLPKANHDYCLFLEGKGAKRKLKAFLGFGKDSSWYLSNTVSLEDDRWYHVAFAYDGKGGGVFQLDAREVGRATHEGRGPVSAGPYHLCIGARLGSTHIGFPGFIDQVRVIDGVSSQFKKQ